MGNQREKRTLKIGAIETQPRSDSQALRKSLLRKRRDSDGRPGRQARQGIIPNCLRSRALVVFRSAGSWRNFFRERGGMLGCTVRPHADSPSNRSAKAARLIQEA